MKTYFTAIGIFFFSFIMKGQETTKLPFYQLPEYAETYTAGTVAARMVAALGFRYHWASDNLNKDDLIYQHQETVRSTGEIIDHILDLSYIIVNATLKQPNLKNDLTKLSFEDKRNQTLVNLQTAVTILSTSEDISQYYIIYGERKIPFWNAINGPIADAIWHCGQIASNRRSSGNPINAKINHFMGTVKE
jgi:hypothetical protein